MKNIPKSYLILGSIAFVLLCAVVWQFTAGSSKGPKLAAQTESEAPRPSILLARASDLVTDPFFHPSIQTIAPAGPAVPPIPSASPTVSYPSPGGAPPSLGGSLPYGAPGSLRANYPVQVTLPPTGQAPGTEQAEPQPNTPDPVRVALRGIVTGDSPSAFVSVNGGPTESIKPGQILGKRVRVTSVTDSSITLQSGDKSLTLKTGQVDSL